MAARIPLGKGLTSAANSASVLIRLANPPFIFMTKSEGEDGVAWTGAVAIQHTLDTPPFPNNGGGYSNSGVSDADADWVTIIASIAPGDQVEWTNPLYRVRALTTGITGGNPSVYMLENIRQLKHQSVTVTN